MCIVAKPYIHKGDAAIDIGCGPGFFTMEMAKLTGDGGQVLAIDLQKEMLAKVAHKALLKQMTHIITPISCTLF